MILRRWLLAIALAVLLAAAGGLIAGAVNAEHFALTAVVFAVLMLGPLIALGWALFVAPKTVDSPADNPDTIEARWSQQAAAGAWRDTITATSAVLVLVAIFGFQWHTTFVLLGVVLIAMASLVVRSLLLRHQEG